MLWSAQNSQPTAGENETIAAQFPSVVPVYLVSCNLYKIITPFSCFRDITLEMKHQPYQSSCQFSYITEERYKNARLSEQSTKQLLPFTDFSKVITLSVPGVNHRNVNLCCGEARGDFSYGLSMLTRIRLS
jgi:hypothetical protein